MFSKMTKISLKLFCLVLALALAVGCSSTPEDTSSGYYYYEEVIVEDETGDTGAENSSQAEATDSNTESTNSQVSSSTASGTASNATSSTASNTTSNATSSIASNATSSTASNTTSNATSSVTTSNTSSATSSVASNNTSSATSSVASNTTSSATSSVASNSTSSATSSVASNNTSSTTSEDKKRPSDTNNAGGVDANKYRGSKVVYATWKNPHQNEDGPVVDSFEKKYGIKVEIDMVPQETYVQEISGKIAAGNSPDVFFDNCFFPASLSVLQPLDAMQLNLNDGIWDKGMIEMSTLGGKPFLVNTVGNIWAEVDCLFYNKQIFADNNITTPEEYQKAGKWTFEALERAMTAVKNAGYIGGYIDVQSLLASTGSGFYNFKNGQFTNGVNKMTTDVITKISQWVSDGLIKDPRESNLLNNFITGKCGIAVTNAYGMKATGYFSEMNPNHVGFTYIPKYNDSTKSYTTGLFRGWGLIRGAKHPVEAGIFLRYYLDVNNYDVASAFINPEAQSFFLKLTSGVDTDQKNPYMLLGISQLCSEKVSDYTGISGMAPGQVSTQISSISPKIDSNAKKVNAEIDKQLKSLKLK